MRRTIVPLAVAALATLTASASDMPLTGSPNNLSLRERCNRNDPTTASAELQREVTFTGASLAFLLNDAAAAATPADLPQLRLTVVGTERLRNGAVNNVLTRRAWQSSCTNSPTCFDLSPPPAGDFVEVTVTPTVGNPSVRFYGNFDANGTVASVLGAPFGANHTLNTFTLSLAQPMGLDSLTHGIPTNQIASVKVRVVLDVTVNAECNPPPAPTQSLDAEAVVDFNSSSHICYDGATPC